MAQGGHAEQIAHLVRGGRAERIGHLTRGSHTEKIRHLVRVRRAEQAGELEFAIRRKTSIFPSERNYKVLFFRHSPFFS
ncbi:hypothetical protein P5G65_08160 [Paenibacillus chondroitinus]|uniref:Uncharacterized protein n=1 Tax=Paenibacillus chondroitinus TaxID=59842 RepID=A0ABU6D7X9_9BACL|nr:MULTISPECIES: hypothetical protein [Paenibacillus]MCY9661779.1 hypothetical protein [Paenibacillus anseongense]MEB4793864.1 hypothetical protein [Paenibacillus chondroitinus]